MTGADAGKNSGENSGKASGENSRKDLRKDSQKNSWRGWLLFVAGLFVMAFGVAFSIKANLGTSPISSLPYILSVITPLTVGTATIALHCVLITLQILILRKQYRIFKLLQLPIAILFGYLTDFSIAVTDQLSYSGYGQQVILCIIGILLVGTGVWMEVRSHVITLAGEGFVLAVCQVCPIKFSSMKVIFDVSLVVISCVLGLLFAGGIKGVREGTVAAAVCVGLITKLINRIYEKICGQHKDA